MAENPAPGAADKADVQARLEDIAALLRESSSLDTSARAALVELVDELTRSLEAVNLPAAELAHLADTTVRLAEALHHKHDQGVIDKARESLNQAVGAAEASAPFAVGLARRLLDALAQIGI